ncbi:MAG: hypothetical protein AAFN13_03655, partial [Bacteroidota bacterium]
MTDQGQVITLDPAGILTVSPRDEEFDAHAFTTDEEAATLIGIRDRQVIARRIRYNGSTAWTSVVEEFPEGLQQNFQFTAAQTSSDIYVGWRLTTTEVRNRRPLVARLSISRGARAWVTMLPETIDLGAEIDQLVADEHGVTAWLNDRAYPFDGLRSALVAFDP